MSADSVARPFWYSHRLNRLVYYRVAGVVAELLPRRLRLGVARLVGRVAARCLPEERARVRGNLARILPQADARALDRAVAETFANFAACFSDFLTVNRGSPARLRDYVSRRIGEEHVDFACEAGRGVILLTAHLGNWEFGGRLLEAVAMQGDRPTGERGDMLVEFFGAPVAFPVGPFVLARAANAPVVPAYCAMDDDRRYRISVEPPIWVKPGEEAAALATMVTTLERAVRAHPTQWFNFFDVWSPPRVAA